MDEYKHNNLMDRTDDLREEVKEVKTETLEVIGELNAFQISKLMTSCSEGLLGVYTSPGNREMSHDEKRIMAQGMLYRCMEDILKVPSKDDEDKDYYKNNTTMIILAERALNLNDASLSHGGLEKVLKHYSRDIENLADYIGTSRDLNINGDSDLGDNDKRINHF